MSSTHAACVRALQEYLVSHQLLLSSMHALFAQAYDFDQPLDGWNVSSVTTFYGCFWSADAFTHWESLLTWHARRVRRPSPAPRGRSPGPGRPLAARVADSLPARAN